MREYEISLSFIAWGQRDSEKLINHVIAVLRIHRSAKGKKYFVGKRNEEFLIRIYSLIS